MRQKREFGGLSLTLRGDQSLGSVLSSFSESRSGAFAENAFWCIL